jgi:hypothetical protein
MFVAIRKAIWWLGLSTKCPYCKRELTPDGMGRMRYTCPDK